MMLGHKTMWCDARLQDHMVGCWVTRPYGVMLGHKAMWCDAGLQGHMV